MHSEPNTKKGAIVRRLRHLEEVTVLDFVYGEQWIVSDQTWQSCRTIGHATGTSLKTGISTAPGPLCPIQTSGRPSSIQKQTGRIGVSLNTQRLTAYIGDEAIHTALVTTGKSGYETPVGTYRLWPGGRRLNETMTSTRAGIADRDEEYNVKNVLYTQYFDALGDALHMNYWQPEWVFGWQRTSHGCNGLLLHDAQWLWLFVQSGTALVVSA